MQLRRSPVWAIRIGLSGLCAFAVLPAAESQAAPTSLPSSLFSAGPPGASKPDDITLMNNRIYVTYQNNAPADGSDPSAFSTIAELDLSGNVLQTINISGRVDGLSADPFNNRLIATINEDNLSSLDVLTTSPSFVATPYTYSPNPATSPPSPAMGGTDSIAVANSGPNEQIIVAHSNPNDAAQSTDYSVSLSGNTATLTPLFRDNGPDASGHAMAVTDPDSNTIVPAGNRAFANQFLQDSQGDGVLLLTPTPVTAASAPVQVKLFNSAGGLNNGKQPAVDDTAFTTASEGTLYVVDQGTGKIDALPTGGFPSGTAFTSQPADATTGNVGALNVVDLTTGRLTPLAVSFTSPKGLLFVPNQPGPVVPETRTLVLLPLTGVALGVLVLGRRRRRTTHASS